MSKVGTTNPNEYKPPHPCAMCGKLLDVGEFAATVSPNKHLLPHFHFCSIVCLKQWLEFPPPSAAGMT